MAAKKDVVNNTDEEDIPTDRDQGDGAPEGEPLRTEVTGCNNRKNPFSFNIEVDFMQLVLFILALVTRLWQLDRPKAVVFDEVHYGRFAAMYAKKTFFFDVHPPLGKLLIGLAGYLSDFNGDFNFDKIGSNYTSDVPVWQLRMVPALCGSLLVPVSYQIAVELGISRWSSALCAILVLTDNALLTQSRFILMDALLLLAISVAMLSYLKFKMATSRCSFSPTWWIWLSVLSVSLTSALSIKYISVWYYLLIGTLVSRDLWRLLPCPNITNLELWGHLLARLGMLVVLPILLYTGVFYIHLSVLVKAGPHDDIMSSSFQTSLQGGLAAITNGQPLYVSFGSQITLRHTHSAKPCWLHSHPQVYPVRYPDQRGSSHQQQVTCYSYKDINNWWIIKDPNRSKLSVDAPVRPVKDGDIVQLLHGITSRALNSHDVAAPVSPQHQEVSCYIDYNISVPAQNLWRVEVVNKQQEGSLWKTIRSHIQLVHVNTSQALKISGKQLPEWGFYQYEVATDRRLNQEATVWNVEEHRYTQKNDSEDERENEFAKAAMLPTEMHQLSFFMKMVELQWKMWTWQKDTEMEHRYSSTPLEWPLLERNVAYWISSNSNAQIHLLGNVVSWVSGVLGLLAYAVLITTHLLLGRRQISLLCPEDWEKFVVAGELAFAGYCVSYLPFFLVDHTLFLHHYLPALFFKLLLLPCVIEHIYNLIWSDGVRTVYKMVLAVWLTAVFNTFLLFLPISFGEHYLTHDQLLQLRWRDTWDFVMINR